jgi:hypothetical protein
MVLPTAIIEPALVPVRAGYRLAVRRSGNGGVPLLLVHGFPCTSRIWSHNLAPLAEAGFDVAAPDLRGYGDSDFAPDGYYYDFNAFNSDLIGLLDAFGWDRAMVVGHDLGQAETRRVRLPAPPRPPRRSARRRARHPRAAPTLCRGFYGHRMWCPPDGQGRGPLHALGAPDDREPRRRRVLRGRLLRH